MDSAWVNMMASEEDTIVEEIGSRVEEVGKLTPKLNVTSSKIPLFTGMAVELGSWLKEIEKKGRIYNLTNANMISLAYDSTEGAASEWIGEYLVKYKAQATWKMFEHNNQKHFGSHSNRTEAARALERIRQIDGEKIAPLEGRMSVLTKVAYLGTDRRNDPATQAQLAEFFTDTLTNPQLREVVARAQPNTLEEVFSQARRAEALLLRLGKLGGNKAEWLKICYGCGKRGYIRATCPELHPNWEEEAIGREAWKLEVGRYIPTPGRDLVCFVCRKGYRANDCRIKYRKDPLRPKPKPKSPKKTPKKAAHLN